MDDVTMSDDVTMEDDASDASSNLSVYNRMPWQYFAIYVHHRLYLDLTSVRAAFGAWALLLEMPGLADSEDEFFFVC